MAFKFIHEKNCIWGKIHRNGRKRWPFNEYPLSEIGIETDTHSTWPGTSRTFIYFSPDQLDGTLYGNKKSKQTKKEAKSRFN